MRVLCVYAGAIASFSANLPLLLLLPLPFAVSAEVNLAIQRNECTFKYTGANYHPQMVWRCISCRLTSESNRGVCATCKDKCHAGHELVAEPNVLHFFWYVVLLFYLSLSLSLSPSCFTFSLSLSLSLSVKWSQCSTILLFLLSTFKSICFSSNSSLRNSDCGSEKFCDTFAKLKF